MNQAVERPCATAENEKEKWVSYSQNTAFYLRSCILIYL